jgi:ubiquitin-protein ligase
MTGHKFKADAISAAAKVAQGLVPGVTHITAASDGEVVIAYSHAKLGQKQIAIRAVAQNVSDYPEMHSFMLFTEEDDTATDVLKTLTNVQEFSFGSNVYEILGILSKKLGNTLGGTSKKDDDVDSSSAEEDAVDAEPDEEEYDYEDDQEDDDGDWGSDPVRASSNVSIRLDEPMPAAQKQALRRLKQDAQTTRRAGFRVGALNGFGTSNNRGILSISIRVNKLDLSEDALEAWGIRGTDYVVLLLRYEAGYVPLETILERAAINSSVEYRIGLSQRYKPSATEAQAAFADKMQTQRDPMASNEREGFRRMHVSISLNQFLNETFVSLVKLRMKHKTDWDGANEIFIGRSGLGSKDEMDFEYDTPAQDNKASDQCHHHILSRDHLMEEKEESSHGRDVGHGRSFLLVAMQFALHFFTKCTKYCLRCHRKMEEGFEALRPYVCSDPLCLFQYMALGLGPDLEQEILTQPAVVDLLVSLCYASLQPTGRRDYLPPDARNANSSTYCIREFPVGLQLRVPVFWKSSTAVQAPAFSSHQAWSNAALASMAAIPPAPIHPAPPHFGGTGSQAWGWPVQVLPQPGPWTASVSGLSGPAAPLVNQGGQHAQPLMQQQHQVFAQALTQAQLTWGPVAAPPPPVRPASGTMAGVHSLSQSAWGQVGLAGPAGSRRLQPTLPSPQKPVIRGTISYSATSAIVLNSLTDLDCFSPGQRFALRYVDPKKPQREVMYPDHDAVVTGLDGRSNAVSFRSVNLNDSLADTMQHSSATIDGPGGRQPARDSPALIPTATRPTIEVEIFHYDVEMDDLPDNDKSFAMRYLLDTIPRISELHESLKAKPGAKLRSFECLSPASYALLSWIVSSNRSYIHKVSDGLEGASGPEPGCIPCMNGWMQFRFSQGSPDGEARFQTALHQVAQRKDLSQHPTIFAWHGSNVANWHSILRSGLDFKDVNSGRAFGHGVYFSPDFNISAGYTAAASLNSAWANADISVSSVMSLNEIINAPEEFVSSSPHYVVSQPDWHQCRYLFVRAKDVRDRYGHGNPVPQVATSSSQPATTSAGALLKQPPGREIRGPCSTMLQLPVDSMPSRLQNLNEQKVAKAGKIIRILEEDSEEDDATDRDLLAEDDDRPASNNFLGKRSRDSSEDTLLHRKRYRTTTSRDISKTTSNTGSTTTQRPPTPALDESLPDFRPGTLNLEALPRLDPPSWATGAATQALSRELKKLQAIQAKTPLHQLGWFIDFDNVTNLFQWVVELHSFDSSLPFAQDMKKHGITSIVTEIRFGKDWPLSPPFVRVIRPRFLPFIQGGGGHVTGGGAMCLELLTNTGWSPANSMESVIIQVRIALTNLEPRPARLQPAGDYGILEAIEAYQRVAVRHGWAIPKDLKATALGGEDAPLY